MVSTLLFPWYPFVFFYVRILFPMNTRKTHLARPKNIAETGGPTSPLRSASATHAPFSPWSLLEVWKSPAEGRGSWDHPHGRFQVASKFLLFFVYHLVMTNIAMEAIEKPYKWRFRSLGKSSISMGHGFHGYVSHNLRVTPIILGKSYDNLPRIRWEL